MKKIITVILLCSLLVTVCGCLGEKNIASDVPTDTVTDTTYKETDNVTGDKSYDSTYEQITEVPDTRDPEFGIEPHVFSSETEFALELLKNIQNNDENVILSPLSIQLALAMTAEGAQGRTRTELLNLIGGEPTLEQLPQRLRSLCAGEYYKFHSANSLWLRNGFSLKNEFSSIMDEKYSAQCESRNFNNDTKNEINSWIQKNTDGMIQNMLQDISPENVMYLINALVLSAEWKAPLSTCDGTFKTSDGDEQNVKMLVAENNTVYLEGYNVKGFRTEYKGGLSLVALMPDEGVSLSEYVKLLKQEELSDILRSEQAGKAEFPEFKSEFEIELSEILKQMGVITPFDENKADFSNMLKDTSVRFFISKVLQKTAIEFNTFGLHAASSTVVEMVPTGAPWQEIKKKIVLDRPFVYMIMDHNDVPLFIGTVNSIK